MLLLFPFFTACYILEPLVCENKQEKTLLSPQAKKHQVNALNQQRFLTHPVAELTGFSAAEQILDLHRPKDSAALVYCLFCHQVPLTWILYRVYYGFVVCFVCTQASCNIFNSPQVFLYLCFLLLFVVKEKKNQLYLSFNLLWAFPSFETIKLQLQNLNKNLGI